MLGNISYNTKFGKFGQTSFYELCPVNRIAIFLLVLLSSGVFAQNKIHSHNAQYWGGYITSTRIHSKLSLWNDAHYVPGSFFIGRHGLSVHLNEQITATGGYAWLFLSPSFSDNLMRAEHRPWAQMVFNFSVG